MVASTNIFMRAALEPGFYPAFNPSILGQGSSIHCHTNKILAPMVRVGTLPHRLLALSYGADLVYTPEIVDRRLSNCERVENPLLNTIDYLDPNGGLCLRISSIEQGKCILQLGTSGPELATDALKYIYNDIVGVDINCGCPKKFSLVSAMGAALLKFPNRIIDIINAIKTKYPHLKVSCKLRMIQGTENVINEFKNLSISNNQIDDNVRSGNKKINSRDMRKKMEPAVAKYIKSNENNNNDRDNEISRTYIEETLDFVKNIYLKTKVDAIAMHCRFPFEKTGASTAHWDIFKNVFNMINNLNEDSGRNVIFIANGDIFNRECAKTLISECKEFAGSDNGPALMFARAAQFNPSVFRTVQSLDDEINETMKLKEPRIILEEYIKVALKYEMPFFNCKYCILILWPYSLGSEIREILMKSRNYKDVCNGIGGDLLLFYESNLKVRQKRLSDLGLEEIEINQEKLNDLEKINGRLPLSGLNKLLNKNIVGVEYSGLRPNSGDNIPIRYYVQNNINDKKINNKIVIRPTFMEEDINKGDLPYIPDDRGFKDVYKE